MVFIRRLDELPDYCTVGYGVGGRGGADGRFFWEKVGGSFFELLISRHSLP